MTATPGPGDGQIRITWTPPTSGHTPTWWQVSIREAGSLAFYSQPLLAAASRSYTFFIEPNGAYDPNTGEGGLTPGAAYDVQVRSVYHREFINGNGENIRAFYYGGIAQASGVLAKGGEQSESPPEEEVIEAGKLIGNTTWTRSETSDLAESDNAQAFTTGSHSEGYKLTSVKLDMTVTSAVPTYTVSIYGDGGSAPSGLLSTLANPPSLSTGLNTFTASGDGIDLAADTTYWVVIDVTAGDSNLIVSIDATSFDSEDPNGAAGWSIADDRLSKPWNSAGWATEETSLKLEIHGYAR